MNRVIRLLTTRAESLRGDLADDKGYVSYLRERGRHSEAEAVVHRINEKEAFLDQIEDVLEILENLQ